MKHHLTKRILALLLSLVMVLGLLPVTALAAERSYDGTEKLYVDLGAVEWWQNDNPTQRAYFFGGNGSAWALLEPEEGTVYKTAVPAGTWTHVILVRCDPSYQGDDYWPEGSKWNQTGDIALDEEKNFLQSFGEGSAEATWGTWPQADPEPSTEVTEPTTEPPVTEAPAELLEIPLPNGDFETGDTTNWIITGLPDNPVRQNQWNEPNTSWTLNLWANDNEAVEIHAKYPVKLTAGTYKFSFFLSGQGVDSNLRWTVYSGDTVLIQQADTVATVDWNVWNTIETSEFTLEADTEVVFDFGGTGPVKYWGDLDNLKLFGTGEIYTAPLELQEITLPNGDFEAGNTANWVVTGLPENPVRQNQWNEPNTSWTLNLWANDNEAVEIHAKYPVKLSAGTYKFSFLISGQGVDSGLRWTVYSGDTALIQQADTVTTVDWNVWNTIETEEFTLNADTEVTFDFGGTGPVKYWADLDDLKLFGTGVIVKDLDPDHTPTLAVEKVPGVDSDDFMRGTDVSSFLSILNSGAKFYDYEGNELDGPGFFELLASAGFNYIRLRIWNDPFDANGNGYGGGNCDVEAAKIMGKWASDAGMKVLIDFHYSDFWADPGKQKAPKAWAGYTADQKAAAVDQFTYSSLKTLLEAGVNVGMVQVGNETTGSICGESSWPNKAKIFSAGSAAVRRIAGEKEHPILVAIHFTNPERSGNYANQAQNLNNYNVDYDVFASSWYPFWHGTTGNLTSVLKQVADTFNKKVVVAETSWAWTLADGDGHDNTVRVGNNDSGAAYPFSQQGQADELVAATKAVTAVGEAGIGVFYWENAWIPVQYAYDENGARVPSIVESNKQKWEQFGSGWASSYAAEYDPNDAGKWYGGSAVDNQSMFDFNGKALDSLWTWQYMMIGTDDLMEKQVEAIETLKLSIDRGGTLSLPETVQVTYNVGGVKDEPVTWNAEELAAVDVNTPGRYTVHGVVTLSYELGTGETQADISVLYPNLLQNPSFELSDMSMYTYSGGSRTGDDPHTGSRSFHFYNSNGGTVELSQSIVLAPGSYSFSLFTQGDAKGSTDMYIYVTIGNGEPTTQSFALAGWAVWQNPEIEFTLDRNARVTVGIHLAYGAGGWGTIDDLYLGGESEAPSGDVSVFFVDESNHENINYYAFGPNDAVSAPWPGEPLNRLGTTEEGHNIYLTELNGSLYDHVIFNDGTWQTGDLAVVDPEKNLPYTFGTLSYVVYEGDDTAEDLFMLSARTNPNCTQEGVTTLISLITGEIVRKTTPALGHDWGEWTVIKEPSCTEAGQKSHTCSRCEETETEEIPALDGEALAEAIAQAEALDPALYTEESFAALTEALNAAKEAYENAHSQEEVDAATQALLAALEALEERPESKSVAVFYVDEAELDTVSWYAFGPNGAESAPWPGTSLISGSVDRNGHRIYVIELDANTYSHVIFTDGSGWQTQNLPLEGEYGGATLPYSYEGTTYVVYFGNTNEADEEGHYKAWPADDVMARISYTNPSCTEDGVITLASLITGETVTETTPALGHDWGEWTVVKEPSCTEAGQKSRTCSRCEETETEEIPALDGEALAEAIAQAEALDPALYTEESFAALTEALNAAKEAYENAHSQEEVDAATQALLAALEALEEKPESKPVTVFYVDEAELDTVNWYAFGPNGAESAPWPGTALNSGSVDRNEHKIYVIELDASIYSHIIFTDGSGWQTQDLPLEGEYAGATLPYSYEDTIYIVFFGNTNEADDQGHYKAWPADDVMARISYTSPSCTEDGVLTLRSLITGETVTETTPALGHDWEISYQWAEDNSSATASAVCKNDDSHIITETVETTYDVITEPTETEAGLGRYTAVFENELFSPQTQDVVIPALEPTEPEYYLFGWINGADYPAEGLGEYKFENGQLTVTFTEDSYVAVQTNTGKRYMTAGWQGNVNEAILYDVDTISNGDKLWAPGGVELTFTLTVNEDGTLKLAHNGEVPQPQEPVYYLVGDMNDWTPSEEYKLLPGENEGEFVLTGIELTAGTEVKVVDQPNDLWYPANNYQITEDGTYDLSFYPNGTQLEGYTDGVLKLTKQNAPQPEPHPIDVYYVDEEGLTAVYCYAFDMLGGSASGEWPGTALEALGQDRNGNNVYKVTLDASLYTHVIFTDGNGWQTQDLAFGEDANDNDVIVYFGNSSEADEQGHYKAWPAEDVEKIVSRTEPSCTEPGALVLESFVTGLQRTEVLEPLGHDWGEWTGTEPSCTEPGVKTRTCSRCGETETETLDALGHDWNDGAVTAPSCTEGGWTLYTCRRCGETRKEDLTEPLGHDWSDWTVSKEPSCTEGGIRSRTCARCGTTQMESLAALGHDWDDGVVTTPPTALQPGVRTYTCRRCGETRTEEIPKLDFLFDDVLDPDAYYFEPVYWAYYHDPQITNGTSATTFSPDRICSRGEIVTFLWRAMGKEEPGITEHPFTDVTEDYYYTAMLWALEKGVTTGTSATTFEPGKSCTRAEVVTFLWRALGCPPPESSENPFGDVEPDSWYTSPVLWAVEQGITNGTGEGFSPTRPCTRAEIVTFLWRAFRSQG